ncbi:MAG: hypothetical protein ACJ8FY_10245 [Gemmataceae bacterium]
MLESNGYKYLEPRPGSNYRQLFYKGRNLRAEVLYRETIGLEPRTPEELANDYRIPVEAVYEAIDYCVKNEELLRAERDRTLKRIHQGGFDRPPSAPADYKPES